MAGSAGSFGRAADGVPTQHDAQPVAHGTNAAYKILGELPMMHTGRIKPLDTVAREEVKQIYTRETIKLPGKDGKAGSTWTPVAAFLDWSVRPKFWDAQPIIPVEYLPLKRLIFADEVHEALDDVAGKASTPPALQAKLKELAHSGTVDSGQLRNVVRDSGLPKEDGENLLALAARIGEETKYLAPADLESSQVTVDGKAQPLLSWLDGLARQGGGGPMAPKPKRTDLEEKAVDLASKLAHYRAIRDREPMGLAPLLAMPRPANDAMLKFSAAAVKKYREIGETGLDPLESESLAILFKFLNDIPGKERALPGEDPAFDTRYKAWVKDKSAWVPLNVVRGAAIEELTSAGFPTDKVEAFRAAFQAIESEELLHPGQADPQPSLALIQSARDLGTVINPDGYPSPETMTREAHFNDVAPFFKAPIAYGSALFLLLMSLVTSSFGKSMKLDNSFGKVSTGLYLAGLAAFAAGIGLEIYGFYLRVRITGWAPVSNMYETVIWVALVASVLGLVIEAIYRRTYAALAAAGVALLGTGLAATVPLLDPTIKQLPPVLRSNYWLTIHVLTIVSSYAAFALAMGLGVVATATYLVATYKRSAGLAELATPLAVGLPVLGVGTGVAMMADKIALGPLWASYGFYGALVVAAVGGLISGMAVFSILGELLSRVIFERQARLARRDATSRVVPNSVAAPFAASLASGSQGGTAVLLAEPPAATATSAVNTWSGADDLRTRVMQSTAAQIKPMASFIYRSMQVGILLVAIGTFLGGWWADVSWGRFWGWDPKETWALITLLVYLMPLHGRFAGWVNTFWLVMSSVLCFLSVLMAWYGVNFVLGVGLHSYGFGEGGGQGWVALVTLVTLAFAGGAYWRRKVASTTTPSLA